MFGRCGIIMSWKDYGIEYYLRRSSEIIADILIPILQMRKLRLREFCNLPKIAVMVDRSFWPPDCSEIYHPFSSFLDDIFIHCD